MVVVMVVAFALSAGVVIAGKTSKCTVEAIDGGKVTLNCEKTDNLKVGQKVKVKKAKKKLEGC